MTGFISSLRASITLLVIMTVLLGGVYPFLVMAVSQTVFHFRSGGSLIERGDRIVGSTLLGQEFTRPDYFWGRLSATTPPYNAAASGGSNLSPDNPKLLEAANARIAALQQADPTNKARIPIDLITSSASGLDPHISLAAAQYQTVRVAKARHMKVEEVQLLIAKSIERPFFGLLQAPYVNVVKLNIALDDMHGDKR